jgi:hypothetical protein
MDGKAKHPTSILGCNTEVGYDYKSRLGRPPAVHNKERPRDSNENLDLLDDFHQCHPDTGATRVRPMRLWAR